MKIFNINQNYKLIVTINKKILTFTGKIIFEDEDFFKFIDKFDIERGYSKKSLISWEVLNE